MADGMDIASALAESWYPPAQLAGLPGVPGTARRVRAMAKREGWPSRPHAGRGGGVEYAFSTLPKPTQAALLLRANQALPPERRLGRKLPWSDARIKALWDRYNAVKQAQKDIAEQRLKAVFSVDALVRAGTPLLQARDAVAQTALVGGKPVTAVSIARWQKRVAGAHRTDWLALLVPSYTGRTAEAEMPQLAWSLYKADWLRNEQPSATSCYDRLQRIADKKGWTLPSLRTFERRIERELDPAVIVLARQGNEAMERMYPAQERDRSMFAALEGVNSDGHRWDFNVRFPDGEIGRPAILGWQDLYSGKMLSFRLCDHESSDAIRLSFGDMVRKYGVPVGAWLDNGRAYASKWMTGGTPNRYRFKVKEEDPVGLITAVGTEVHWVTPYHGQAKPIERCWRDFCDRIAKHPAFAGAYVGNNPVNKPANYGERAVEWDEFVRVVTEEVTAHNARKGRRSKVCGGTRSFDDVFNASYAHTTVRKVSAEQLGRLLLAAEAVTASSQDGSVRLAGNRYWTEELARHAGHKVVIRIDPANLHGDSYIYALDGTFIATAPCVASVGFADTGAAREHARGKAQYRRAQKAMLAAENLMDAAAVASQLPPPAPEATPPAGVVAPVFRNHGAPRIPQPAERLAPTGTDGGDVLGALDKLMLRKSLELNDKPPKF